MYYNLLSLTLGLVGFMFIFDSTLIFPKNITLNIDVQLKIHSNIIILWVVKLTINFICSIELWKHNLGAGLASHTTPTSFGLENTIKYFIFTWPRVIYLKDVCFSRLVLKAKILVVWNALKNYFSRQPFTFKASLEQIWKKLTK